MDILFSRKQHIIAGLFALTCCCFLVLFPEISLYSAQKGISLWMTSVVPALLPFFICANFLSHIGVTRLMGPGIFPFVMSVLSGYPVGAKIIGDMAREGRVSGGEARRLISFCSTSGPTFMIGAVGIGMLGSASAGMLIAAAHYLGAVVNGAFYSLCNRNPRPSGTLPAEKSSRSLLEHFTDAIFSSFKSLAVILAYIVLFMFFTDILYMSGFLQFLPSPEMKALVRGFFEMTVGCGALSECVDLAMTWKCVLSASVISWGGLSVWGQSMSMLSGSGVTCAYFTLTKVTHCIFAGIIAMILSPFML